MCEPSSVPGGAEDDPSGIISLQLYTWLLVHTPCLIGLHYHVTTVENPVMSLSAKTTASYTVQRHVGLSGRMTSWILVWHIITYSLTYPAVFGEFFLQYFNME